jgi:hypothetical protein
MSRFTILKLDGNKIASLETSLPSGRVITQIYT